MLLCRSLAVNPTLASRAASFPFGVAAFLAFRGFLAATRRRAVFFAVLFAGRFFAICSLQRGRLPGARAGVNGEAP